MKFVEYPSISAEIVWGGPYLIWDKLDGSNLRAEWSKKRGFYKLGARRTHLEDRYRDEAAHLIEFQRQGIVDGFRKHRWDHGICFFEFYGAKSISGVHQPNDPKMIALLDVVGPDELLMDTRDFHKTFYERVQTPQLLHRGNFNQDIHQAVKTRTLPGMTFEGVIAKGVPPRKDDLPTMFKCKSEDWFAAIRKNFGDKAEQHF